MEVVDYAQQLVSSRNNHAYALLDHVDPQLSIIVGNYQGVELLSSGHALLKFLPWSCK
jgi:hypothetical protein